jgi:hypothetical protein
MIVEICYPRDVEGIIVHHENVTPDIHQFALNGRDKGGSCRTGPCGKCLNQKLNISRSSPQERTDGWSKPPCSLCRARLTAVPLVGALGTALSMRGCRCGNRPDLTGNRCGRRTPAEGIQAGGGGRLTWCSGALRGRERKQGRVGPG